MAARKPTRERLGAFSDGAIAIIITIMVLELKPPHHAGSQRRLKLWPAFLSYALGYLFVGVFWANHHHILMYSECVEPPMI